jgi:hypothetical protein
MQIRSSLAVASLLLAALACSEEVGPPTESDGTTPALDFAPAQTLSFRQVSTGFSHTCGVTTDDVAYC